jgi:hypothetical protein
VKVVNSKDSFPERIVERCCREPEKHGFPENFLGRIFVVASTILLAGTPITTGFFPYSVLIVVHSCFCEKTERNHKPYLLDSMGVIHDSIFDSCTIFP